MNSDSLEDNSSSFESPDTQETQRDIDHTPVSMGKISDPDPFRFSALGEENALGVKSLMDQQAPEAPYAAYFYAMCGLFVPDTSVVAANQEGRVVGAVVGMYDFNFKRLVVSHLATAISLEAKQANDLKSRMLTQAFTNAAAQGALEITAELDGVEDPALQDMAHRIADQKGLVSRVTFRNATAHQSPDLETGLKNSDMSEVDRSDIIYRHPDPESAERDGSGLWTLIHEIRNGSSDGGLDIYAASNYVRLCRDFSETVMLAEHDGQIVGFATGFRIPEADGRKGLFMWQTGTHPAYQGKGIGSRVERDLIDEHNPEFLYFSVVDGYGAAERTAEKKAKQMQEKHTGKTKVFEKPHQIPSEFLGGKDHKTEVVYYIGDKDDPPLDFE